MTSFFGAIQALVQILQMVKEIIAFIQANQDEQWFKDAAKTFSDLRAAKTPDEKKKIAKNIRDLFASA